jgi:hypothetical protein
VYSNHDGLRNDPSGFWLTHTPRPHKKKKKKKKKRRKIVPVAFLSKQ